MTMYKNIVILTGAGLSAEFGLHTFRDKDGIWSKYDVREVATPEGYRRNPALVLDFYNQRRRQNKDVKPNAAHLALARLEAEHPGDVLIVTQNIDPLHEMAGSKNLIHMHGEILARFARAAARGKMLEPRILPWSLRASVALRRERCAPTWFGSAKCPTTWSPFMTR